MGHPRKSGLTASRKQSEITAPANHRRRCSFTSMELFSRVRAAPVAAEKEFLQGQFSTAFSNNDLNL
jgi:hypothetical protein